MLAARCPRCAAEHDDHARFCTRCGLALRPDAVPREEVARFVTCPVCGAANAASRQRCGRCKAPFDPDGDPVPPPRAPAAAQPAPVIEEVLERGPRVVFTLAIVLAGLAIVAVMATLLAGNGVGFLADAAPIGSSGDGDVALPVASIRASSALEAAGDTHEPERLLDGDPSTAWREAAPGQGAGEWVELELVGTPQVSRLVLWNGDQSAERFASSTRAAEVRIDLDERTFTADLLDVPGPQAVELPEQVPASSVRLTVLAVVPARGDLALSGIEVRGPPPTPPDLDR